MTHKKHNFILLQSLYLRLDKDFDLNYKRHTENDFQLIINSLQKEIDITRKFITIPCGMKVHYDTMIRGYKAANERHSMLSNTGYSQVGSIKGTKMLLVINKDGSKHILDPSDEVKQANIYITEIKEYKMNKETLDFKINGKKLTFKLWASGSFYTGEADNKIYTYFHKECELSRVYGAGSMLVMEIGKDRLMEKHEYILLDNLEIVLDEFINGNIIDAFNKFDNFGIEGKELLAVALQNEKINIKSLEIFINVAKTTPRY